MPAGPVRVRGVPTQTGPLLVAVATGRALTTTVVVTAALLHPLALVTTRLYTPAMPRVALADTVGLCVVLVYPNGPVHEDVVMPAGPVRVRGVPTQTGPLFVAVATGRALTTTVVVTAALLHPLALVTTRLYTPAMPRVALADTVGLCVVLVYPNGPVHE